MLFALITFCDRLTARVSMWLCKTIKVILERESRRGLHDHFVCTGVCGMFYCSARLLLSGESRRLRGKMNA